MGAWPPEEVTGAHGHSDGTRGVALQFARNEHHQGYQEHSDDYKKRSDDTPFHRGKLNSPANQTPNYDQRSDKPVSDAQASYNAGRALQTLADVNPGMDETGPQDRRHEQPHT